MPPRDRARPPVLLLGKHITALGVLRTLARDGVEVLGVEASDDIVTRSRFYRRAEATLPETTDPEVLAAFLEGLRLPRAVLMACSDRWIQAVAGLPEALRERFPASVGSPDAVGQCIDKGRFRALVRALGIPAPRSRPIERPEDLDGAADDELAGAFLKPADSQTYARRFRAKGRFVTSRGDALAHVREGLEAGTAFELQEWIPGDFGATILLDGFVDRTGVVRAMSARRRVRMDPPGLANTCCDVTIPIEAAGEAPGHARRLLAALGHRGIFNIEFKRDARDGQFKVIELNPRPFWLVAHIASAGLDLPWLAYLDALGEPVPTLTRYRVGRFGLYELPDAAAILRAVRAGRRPAGPVLRPWLLGDHAALWPTDPLPGILDGLAGLRRTGIAPEPQRGYLMARGLTGEPTAPVITRGGALNRKS